MQVLVSYNQELSRIFTSLEIHTGGEGLAPLSKNLPPFPSPIPKREGGQGDRLPPSTVIARSVATKQSQEIDLFISDCFASGSQ